MYTYAAKVWALSIVQGPFSVAPCQTYVGVPTLALRFAFFAPLHGSRRTLPYRERAVCAVQIAAFGQLFMGAETRPLPDWRCR
jgi:hypothetical protein